MNIIPGSKCWVKMKGYPPWPARINILPEDVKIPRGKIPIFYYGTHEISYANVKDIYDYDKFRHKYCLYKGKNAKFTEALMEIEQNPTILQLGFDTKAAEFLSQFYKFDCQLLKCEQSSRKNKSQETDSYSNRKRQRHKSKTPDINEPERKHKKIQNNEEKNPNSQFVSNSISQKIDQSAVQNHLLKIEKPVLQNHIKPDSSDESLFPNSNINNLEESLLQNHVTNQLVEPLDQNHVCHEKKESISLLKKLTLAQQIEQNIIQPVLQPKNITVTSVKKPSLPSVIETAKQPARESDSLIIIHEEKDTMKNIFKKENREISIVLNDVLTCADILSVRNLTQSGDVKLRETENNNLPDNTDISPNNKSENVNFYSNSFKSPIKTSNNDRPMRASAQKFKQNFLNYLKDLTSSKFTNKKPDVTMRLKKETNKPKKSEKRTEDKNRMKVVEKSSANLSNRSVDYNHNASIPVGLGKDTPCKDETELRIISKLSIIDKEIKKSLIVGQENYEKCRNMMSNLLDLNNLTLISLCQVPEIIVTIRKCRRYKKDDSIKSSACKIFQTFSKLYEQAELEEKASAGAELLKRHPEECKTAQVLFNELFVIEKRQSVQKTSVPSLVLSSPSSAQSFHSSANNTPLLINDTSTDTPEPGLTLDPDLTDINELLRNGILVLIDSYSCDESEMKNNLKTPFEKRSYSEEIELYKQLGV